MADLPLSISLSAVSPLSHDLPLDISCIVRNGGRFLLIYRLVSSNLPPVAISVHAGTPRRRIDAGVAVYGLPDPPAAGATGGARVLSRTPHPGIPGSSLASVRSFRCPSSRMPRSRARRTAIRSPALISGSVLSRRPGGPVGRVLGFLVVHLLGQRGAQARGEDSWWSPFALGARSISAARERLRGVLVPTDREALSPGPRRCGVVAGEVAVGVQEPFKDVGEREPAGDASTPLPQTLQRASALDVHREPHAQADAEIDDEALDTDDGVARAISWRRARGGGCAARPRSRARAGAPGQGRSESPGSK